MRAAEALHVEERDTRYLGKTLLYLDQRRIRLEKVLELADRFLLSGQEVQVHALLLNDVVPTTKVTVEGSLPVALTGGITTRTERSPSPVPPTRSRKTSPRPEVTLHEPEGFASTTVFSGKVKPVLPSG
jgi:hypothetical protein